MVDGATLTGIPASPGRRSGPARVLSSLADLAAVRSGEILVARAMVPELVLVFDRIAGVVTDQGGRLAHASVVARELRVPAVVGTQVATNRIRNGVSLLLDGSVGTVRIGDE